jgi:hypothetical protein
MEMKYEEDIYETEMETERYETKIERFLWYCESKHYAICLSFSIRLRML